MLIPIFVISIIYNENILNKISENESKEENKDQEIFVSVDKNGNIQNIKLEDYLIGVVAGEMPASFEEEALKAQAIASRTYVIYKMSNNKNKPISSTTDDQVYLTTEEMQEKWKDDYNYYFNKIKDIVNSTKNLIMTKDKKVFKAYYFSMSNGYTEDSKAVFGENTINSVVSPWDNDSLKNFVVTKSIKETELLQLINENQIKSIKILSKDSSGRVDKLKINDKIYSGIEFRKLLNLRSTDFEIEKDKDTYLITTKGYGHGVGMSQYGANGMAKENYSYKEILEYYYQNIEITSI